MLGHLLSPPVLRLALAAIVSAAPAPRQGRGRADTCPQDALNVANAVMIADTLGVGLYGPSRDSSQVDTLATERLEGGTDISYVTLTYQLTCLVSTPDSAVFHLTWRRAGRIQPQGWGESFIPDPRTTVSEIQIVMRAGHWRYKGLVDAIYPSPTAALRHYGASLDDNSRRMLTKLAASHR